MADTKKTAGTAPAAKLDPDTIYKVQLKKFVPDYPGLGDLVMTSVYHFNGTITQDLLSRDVVGAYEPDNSVHPDAQAPRELDPPHSDVIDARKHPTDEPHHVPPRGHPGS